MLVRFVHDVDPARRDREVRGVPVAVLHERVALVTMARDVLSPETLGLGVLAQLHERARELSRRHLSRSNVLFPAALRPLLDSEHWISKF